MEPVKEIKRDKKKLMIILISVGAFLVTAAIITTVTLVILMNKVFTVSFDTGTDAEYIPQEVKWGEKVETPVTPPNPNKILNGWYDGDKLWDFENDKVYGDKVLRASWRDSVIAELNVTPARDIFAVGETFTFTGLHVVAIYDDGYSRVLEESEYAVTTNFQSNVVGTYTVTVASRSNNVTQTYEVRVSRLTKLSVSNNSFHVTKYLKGDEISFDNLLVTMEFESGDIEVNYTVIPQLKLSHEVTSETAEATIETVTITYGTTSFSASYPVTFLSPEYLVPLSYSITRPAYATTFMQYGKFTHSGLQISKLTAEFPSRAITVAESEYTVTCNLEEAGSSTAYATANNGDVSVSYAVRVVATSELTTLRVEVDSENTKLVYTVGDAFENSDIVANKICKIGLTNETIKVGLTVDEIIVTTEYNPNEAGSYRVTVTLADEASMTATYWVTVRAAS